MKCSSCGNEISDGTSFCTECGAKNEDTAVLEIENNEAIPAEDAVPAEVQKEVLTEEFPAEEALVIEAEISGEGNEEIPAAEEVPSEEIIAEEVIAEAAEEARAEAVAGEEAPAERKQSGLRRAGKIAGMFAVSLAASFLIVFVNLWLFPKVLIPNVRYFAAGQYYHGGQYEKAAEIYAAMPGFKESKRQCSKAVYALAEKSMEDGNYKKAVACYEWLGSYEDSPEMLEEARMAYGLKLLDEKEYFLAARQFGYLTFDGDEKANEKYMDAVLGYIHRN